MNIETPNNTTLTIDVDFDFLKKESILKKKDDKGESILWKNF